MIDPANFQATSRRGFLKLAATGAAAALSPAPARAAPKTITVLHESSFIKPFDEYVQNCSPPPTRSNLGSRSSTRLTSVGSLPTRISTIAETGSGADITMTVAPSVQFGEKSLDVGDIADGDRQAQGGWYDAGKEAVLVNGKWMAIPFSNIGQLMYWRTDWFTEVGVKKFPDTWEELYEVGRR